MNTPATEGLPGAVGSRPLPRSWRAVRLSDVCEESIPTRDPRDSPTDTFRYVDITSVSNVSKRIVSPKTMLGKDSPSRARQVIRTGDVLVSTTRPNLNAVALVPTELDGEIASTGFCVLRAKTGLDPGYLFGFVQMGETVRNLSDLVKGALYPAVTDAQVRAQWLPLPELLEQRRIVDVLAAQIAAVERARAAAEAQLEAAKALPAAYRRAAFTSAEAQRWARVRLCDLLLEPLRTGISKPARPGADKECLTLSAIRGGFLELSAKKTVGVTDEEANGTWVRADAFYVVRGNGRLSLVGRGALAPRVMPVPVLYPDLLIQVIPDTQAITLGYLRHVWESEEVRADVERRARTSAGIFKINQANLAEVRVPLPDREEQERVAARLDRQLAKSDEVRKSAEERLAAINNVPAALLRRAFSGEL